MHLAFNLIDHTLRGNRGQKYKHRRHLFSQSHVFIVTVTALVIPPLGEEEDYGMLE